MEVVMKILLLGSGGREHALALKLKASAVDLVSAPGSDALAELGVCVKLDLEDPSAVAAWCASNRPDLVVAGPEVPLVAGVGDAVRALGIPVFGHDAATAHLEGSKAFAKDFMERHAIPCAASHTVTDLAAGMMDWIAVWVAGGGTSLNKPTHFEVRDGKF